MMKSMGFHGERPCFSLGEYIQRMASDLSTISSKDLPDFFILSPPRTGTTWLANVLREHPHVYIPPEKELRYFDVGWRFSTIQYYRARYAAAKGRCKGDVSPSYVLLPQRVIRLLRKTKPDLKFIVILRDLDDRAWSNFRHSYTIGEFGLRMRGPLTGQSLDEAACHYLLSDYCTSVGDYREYLSRWIKHYPLSQFLILRLNDIARAPGRVIQQVCDFLGIPTTRIIKESLAGKVNIGAPIPKCESASELLRVLYQARHDKQRSFFRETFGIEVEDQFPACNPTDRPYELVNRADGYKTVIWNGLFFACWLEDFPAMVRLLQEKKSVRSVGLMANHWLELESRIESRKRNRRVGPTDQQLEDERLVRILNALALDYPRSNDIRVNAGEPRIVQQHKGFNLVAVGDTVIGLRQSLGPVDVTAEGPEGLLAKYGPRNVVVTGSVGEAVYAVDMLDDHDIRVGQLVTQLQALQAELARQVAEQGEVLRQVREDQRVAEVEQRLGGLGAVLGEHGEQLRALRADRRVEDLERRQAELARQVAEQANRLQAIEGNWAVRLVRWIARIFQ